MKAVIQCLLFAAIAGASAVSGPQFARAQTDSLATEADSAVAETAASAQGEEAPAATTFAREVGPHRFVGVSDFPNPFLSTHVRCKTGVAAATGLAVDIYDFQDPPNLLATKEGNLMYLVQEFEYQKRVASAVAVRVVLAGSGRLGTETPVLLSEGISVITGWSAGGIVRLSERPSFRLSANLDLAGNSLTAIAPRAFVEDVLANGLRDTTNSLTDDFNNMRVTAGLRAAWARSETVGFMLFGEAGAQEPYDPSEETKSVAQAGGALSLDMRERWKPDIGFNLSAFYRTVGSRNEDLSGGGWAGGLGIFYTGRPDFTLGLQTHYTRSRQAELDNKFAAYVFGIAMRYDFS